MTSAKERAVEEAWYAYEQLPEWDLDKVGVAAMLRAAFPILAEELVKVALAQGARYEHSQEAVCESAYGMSHEIASALRARIQQMAEAL